MDGLIIMETPIKMDDLGGIFKVCLGWDPRSSQGRWRSSALHAPLPPCRKVPQETRAPGGVPTCDGKTWSISRWGYAPVPGPGLDVETSDFLYFQTI